MKKMFCAVLAAMLLMCGCSSGVTQEQYDAVAAENEKLIAQITELETKLSSAMDTVMDLSAEISEYKYSGVLDSTDISFLKGAAADFHEDAQCCLAGSVPVIYIQLESEVEITSAKVLEFHKAILDKSANLIVWRELFSDEIKAKPYMFVLLSPEDDIIVQFTVDLNASSPNVSMAFGTNYAKIVEEANALL